MPGSWGPFGEPQLGRWDKPDEGGNYEQGALEPPVDLIHPPLLLEGADVEDPRSLLRPKAEEEMNT